MFPRIFLSANSVAQIVNCDSSVMTACITERLLPRFQSTDPALKESLKTGWWSPMFVFHRSIVPLSYSAEDQVLIYTEPNVNLSFHHLKATYSKE